MALTAQIQLSILAHETSSGDISRTLRATPVSYALSLTDGTGASQAQVAYSKKATVEPAADDFLFSSGGAADDRGEITFSAIKAIYFRNTGNVTISVSGASDWPLTPLANGCALKPGAVLFLSCPDAAGWPVAGGSLGVNNSAGTDGEYEAAVIGEGTIT